MKVYQQLDDVTKTAISEIAELKTVEAYNDQYRNLENEDPKLYPAAYFELLEPLYWEQGLNNWQHAKVRMRIHVVVFDVKRTKVDLHDISQKVFVRLNGASFTDPTNTYNLTSAWNRVASSVPKRYKQVKVLTIDFEFEAFDASSVPTLGTQTVNITVS